MKKILIDLDYTITDGGYLKMLNEYMKENYSYNDMKGLYYADDLIKDKNKQKDYINYMYNIDNVYNYAHLKEDAYEVLELLNKVYDIYICSAYIDPRETYESGIVCYNKHRWLVDHLPFISPTKFIFMSDKSLVKADIRIDDKLSNLSGEADLKIFIPTEYNKDILDSEVKKYNAIRCDNWIEIKNILLDKFNNPMI